MLRRIGLGTAAVLIVLLFLFGRDTYSYLKTSLGWVKQEVRGSIPIRMELERARQMIADLKPEIMRNMTLIAREEVGIQNLEENLKRAEAELAQSKEEILKLVSDLRSGSDHFVYAGRSYSRSQVEKDLERRFQRHKTKEEAAKHLRQVIEARRTTLAAARDKLEAMLAAKSQLELDIEALESRLKMVEVASTRSDLNIDDSHLARTKELLAEIKSRIEVAAKLVNADEYYHEGIPVSADQESSENVLDEVTRYFDQAASTPVAKR
jgi:chromosome segregation ATPase